MTVFAASREGPHRSEIAAAARVERASSPAPWAADRPMSRDAVLGHARASERPPGVA